MRCVDGKAWPDLAVMARRLICNSLLSLSLALSLFILFPSLSFLDPLSLLMRTVTGTQVSNARVEGDFSRKSFLFPKERRDTGGTPHVIAELTVLWNDDLEWTKEMPRAEVERATKLPFGVKMW